MSLKSVNWVTGMLLTPEQFLQQEQYVDATAGWVLRYVAPATGLVGAGVRGARAAEWLGEFDPGWEVDDDGAFVRVTVHSARGITPSGAVVDLAPRDAICADFPKDEYGWASELFVSLIQSGEKEEDPNSLAESHEDDVYPALRRPRLEIKLTPRADEIDQSLVIGRLRRPGNSPEFFRDDSFIPACATILAHSRLYRAWAEFQQQLDALAAEAGVLHRLIARYSRIVERSGLHSPVDRDFSAYVEHVALAIDACAYAVVDPAAPPQRLFAEIGRLGRSVALATSLVAGASEFLHLVPEADPRGEGLREDEGAAPAAWRGTLGRQDLAEAVARGQATLSRVSRLLSAVRERYLDYRQNRVLPTLRYLVDLETEEVFVARAKVPHTGQYSDPRVFSFADLPPLGPGSYRVVLAGDPDGIPGWAPDTALQVRLTVNAERPLSRVAKCAVDAQRNFPIPLELEGTVMSTLRVEVQRGEWFQWAILCRLKDDAAEPVAAGAGPGAVRAPESSGPSGPSAAPPHGGVPHPGAGDGRRGPSQLKVSVT